MLPLFLLAFSLLPLLSAADKTMTCSQYIASPLLNNNAGYTRLTTNAYIWLELQNENGTFMKRGEFWPRVDDFSQLKINNSYGYNTTYVKACVYGGVNGSFCTNATYQSASNVVSFLTLIITMTRGVITGIEFEDNCYNCAICVPGNTIGTSKTLHGTCGVSKNDLAQYSLTPDIEVHAAWQGTDASGTAMESVGEIFSTYRLFSLTSLSNDLLQWSKLIVRPVRT